MSHIQAMINCDIPGMRTLSHKATGEGSYTDITLSGWLPFKDYLSQLSTALASAIDWTIAYDEGQDRIIFTEGGSAVTASIKFETSTSMASLWGHPGISLFTISAGGTPRHELPSAPDGVVPLGSVHFADVQTARETEIQSYRHGRAYSTAFGNGRRYTLRARPLWADRSRVLEGPCSVGKVRVGDWSASSIYGSLALDGYVDGFLSEMPSLSVAQEDVEGFLELEFSLYSPVAPHITTETLGDAFFGSLKRGNSINYSATIEGVPFRFVETDPGIADSTYTIAPALIVDDAQTLTHKVDRQRGITAASGLRLGILDPSNELEIFGRPSAKIALASAVTYNATTINLDGDTAPFASSGIVYLGNEALRYAAKTGPSDTPANQLQGITRPFGPGYDYSRSTVQKYRTVANRKIAWAGAVVELWGQLLDPYGRAIDTAWRGSYSRHMYTGQVKGLPGYSAGVWVIDTEDLIRRLTKDVGVSASATLAPFDYSSSFNVGSDIDANYLLVHTPDTAWLRVTVDWTGGTDVAASPGTDFVADDEGQFYWDIQITDTTGIKEVTTFVDAMTKLLAAIQYKDVTEGIGWESGRAWANASGLLQYHIDSVAILKSDPAGFMVSEWGQVYFGFEYAEAPLNYAQVSITIGPRDGYAMPYWFTIPGLALFSKEKNTTPIFASLPSGLHGQTATTMFIKQDGDTSAAIAEFPDSGYVGIKGQDGAGEVASYAEKLDASEYPGRIILAGMKRKQSGTVQNVFIDGGELHAAAIVTGNTGEVIAKILESSGNNAPPERGVYDVLDQGFGYALKASDHVLDTTVDVSLKANSLKHGLINPSKLNMVVAEAVSLDKMIGTIVSANGLALSWVRDPADSRLKIGVVPTGPLGGIADHTIGDGDLVSQGAATVARVSPSPNMITVRQAATPVWSGGNTFTYRILEDMAARGGQSATVEIYGVSVLAFYMLAEVYAGKIANNAMAEVAYRFRVAPHKDWLPGQLVSIDITHSGVFDWTTGTPGISETFGRILQVRRNLVSGVVDLDVVVMGQSLVEPLCPAPRITGYDGSTFTLEDASVFSNGDPIRIYTPGVAGAELETSINSLAGNVITPAAMPSPIYPGATCATYPANTSTITSHQNAHAHIADGGEFH